jgi:hypothetical protein
MHRFSSLIATRGARLVAAVCLMAPLSLPLSTHAAAEDQVVIAEEVNLIADGEGEVVAIGGEVKVSGHATDEVVAIGGEVAIDVQSEEETVAIGGVVEIRGTFAGEIVGIGGTVDYYGANTEELVLMGGEITVHEEAISGGPARVFGGEVLLAGRFAGESNFGGGTVEASGQFTDTIKISAVDVTISGSFYGDVSIEGEFIEFAEGAVITGNIHVRSPNKPTFHESLSLPAGSYTYEYIEEYDPKIGDIAISDIVKVLMGVFYVFAIIMCVTVIAALIVATAPARLSRQASAAFRHAPGKSFLVGLAAGLITWTVGLLFLVILIGPILPIFVGFLGYFVAAFTISAMMMRKVGQPLRGGLRLAYTLLGVVMLSVVSLIPILGTLVVFVLSIIGTGAFMLALFKAAPEVDMEGDDRRHLAAFDDEEIRGEPRGDYVHDFDDEEDPRKD